MSKTQGFGFDPNREKHHFVVVLPKAESDVSVYESFYADNEGPQLEAANLRTVLTYDRWLAISEALQEEFKRRLQENRMKPGRWKPGFNPLARLLGKELVLLCWAIEEAEPAQAPAAIENWRGLAPEERWWLYTMTAAQTGHALRDRGRGWRRAVRFALCDNPVVSTQPQVTIPERRERAKEAKRLLEQRNLDLFRPQSEGASA